MGSSSSPDELAAKLFKAGAGIDKASRDGLAKSALLVKSSVVAELGGVTRLRGVGKKGSRIGVRYDLRGDGATQHAEVKATGPFQLIERDTSPHEIGPKGKKRGRNGQSAVRLADGGFRRRVHHPGTTGKHPFARGVARAAPLVPETMMAEQIKSLRKFFG